MADSQDVETLKRRGRRRLVGAIALVLVAVIVLPMVFDTEPRQAPPVSVRIPSEEDPGFKPKVVPKSPVTVPAPAVEARPEPKPEPGPASKPESKAEPKSDPKSDPKPEPKPESKAEAKAKPAAPPADTERKRAEAALAGGAQFIIPVAALATPEKLKDLTEMLASAKLPYFTEPIATSKGTVTRVRAGPFPTRESAEQALQKLKTLGLKPGNVTPR